MRSLALFTLLCIASASAAGPPLVERLGPGPDPLLDKDLAKRKLVVIYYANDRYSPNAHDLMQTRYEGILDTLEAHAKNKALPAERRKRLAALHEALKQNVYDNVRLAETDTRILFDLVGKRFHGLAVFRNWDSGTAHNGLPLFNLFRKFTWHTQQPGAKDARVRSMPVPHQFFRPEYDAQPLAHPAVLRQALAEVAKVFPPKDHRYLLICRTWSTRENVVASMVSVDFGALPLEEALETIEKAFPPDEKLSLKPGADLWGRMNQAFVDRFHWPKEVAERKRIEDRKPVNSEQQLARAAEPGIDRNHFLAQFTMLGGRDADKDPPAFDREHGLYFPLVVVPTCRSALKLTRDPTLHKLKAMEDAYIGNVGRLITWGDDKSDADLLDLSGLLKDAPADFDLEALMLRRWMTKKD